MGSESASKRCLGWARLETMTYHLAKPEVNPILRSQNLTINGTDRCQIEHISGAPTLSGMRKNSKTVNFTKTTPEAH